ncbi:MAG: DUF3656 domain-containing protein [Acutalibacteraceae bacterium]|nr:DUF3656 domain-containing protein [Acutalibacteraceae bacterium]
MMKIENKTGNIEILAPCGSYDSIIAAVRKGADAVYIGSLNFSARAYAANFDDEQLKKAVEYCHLHGVKVHMALNTLLSDSELSEALKIAKKACVIGVDAFIVQDLGLAKLLRQMYPDIVLHASTQMTVHTPSGANMAYSLGFERVVLAREMNRSEIEQVVSSCPAETEVFVHGALCMCVSGQCYLSAMIGGRSGNRGRCAQPCRLPFKVSGGSGYDLSLKDNCIIDKLSQLHSIGVTSAKIEGRMKRPEYAAMAVSACKNSADRGYAENEDIERLKAVFSRSGFTDGYYTGKTGKTMFGVRSKDDVISATDKVLADIRREYKDEIQTNPVDFTLTVRSGVPAVLTARSHGYFASVEGDIPQQASKTPLSADKAKEQLCKTGGTSFYTNSTEIDIEHGLTLPLSSVNRMRREALQMLENQITQVKPHTYADINIMPVMPYKRQKQPAYRASFRNCDIPDIFKECEYVYVPITSDRSKLQSLIERGFNVAAEIPRIMFGAEERIDKALQEVRRLGITDVYCNNIGAVALARKHGFNIHGGFALNVFNSQTAAVYEELGAKDIEASIELKAEQINKLGGTIKRGIVGYGCIPLMIMRNCPNKNGYGCKRCGGRSTITDRKGNKFTLMCSGGCTELFNYVPLVLSDKQEKFKNIDFIDLRFTYESQQECERVYKAYLNGEKPNNDCTAGLYFRGVE